MTDLRTCPLSVVFMATGLLLLSACGSRTEYRVADLVVERVGWDSLYVNVSFARRTAIGGSRSVEPERVTVMLMDGRYDSLYVGPPGRISIPDARLGNRERITIEACGELRGRQVCTQDLTRASPKRIEADAEIEYPTDSELTTGRYELTFRIERLRFESDEWEPIPPVNLSGHILVWVDDPEARRQGTIEIPFTRPRGTFDLSRRIGYRDFRYFLDSEMLDRDTAYVRFDVHAGWNEQPARVSSVRKAVFWKSDDQREEDVRYFAREGAERLVDELESFLGGRRAVAYVDDWHFDARRAVYVLELEVRWEGSFFNRGRYVVEGILEVREDGRDAKFELTDANRRAERRWRSRSDGGIISLGDLGTPADDGARSSGEGVGQSN